MRQLKVRTQPGLRRPARTACGTAALCLLIGGWSIPARSGVAGWNGGPGRDRGSAVDGIVVLDGTDAPVAGSLVTLLSSEGRALSRTVTDAAGRFHLADNGSVVSIEVIGRPPIRAEVPTAGEMRIEVPSSRISLPSGATAECVSEPDAGQPQAVVWSEVRKALQVESWARTHHVYAYDVFQYERGLSERNRIESERGRRMENVPENPSRTRPPDELNADGYARKTPRGDVLYAPDADVLLSDGFARTHCFRVQSVRNGRIGLGFEPTGARDRVDIAGVMWVDERTAELRAIDFHYTGLGGTGPDGPGGTVEFDRLPDGLWSLAKWSVRTPAPRTSPTRFREEGVEVVRVVRLDGTTLSVRPRAHLIGIVRNPAGGTVEGADIRLEGTNYIATTNADGRFYIPELPPGRFLLTVATGGNSPAAGQDVLLAGNQRTQVSVDLGAVKPIRAEAPAGFSASDSLLLFLESAGLTRTQRVDSLITDALTSSESGRLVGRVFDRSSGRGIAGADVQLLGTGKHAITESDGRFFLGDVRAGTYVIHTEMLGYAARSDSVGVPSGLVIDAAVAMNTRPVELEPITVTVVSRWLDSNGFFERRRAGLAGHFFTRSDIEKKQPAQFTDLLRDLPGVLIMTEEVGKTMVRFRRVTTLARSAEEDRGCQPGVYYDGIPLNVGFDLLHNIPIPFIDGVEVYVGSATPIEYKNPCGVILIWTRRPR
jgi:Carboxypeptidase regulatory-like domain/CarboxypepD_reg-like domain/TonB-dependent Receptor Plug Domain